MALGLTASATARADPLPAGHWQVGADVQGALVNKSAGLFLSGIATYTVHDYIAVGVTGGAMVVGEQAWRAGALAEVFLGGEFLRPFAMIRVEAINVNNVGTGVGLGFEFGLAWQPDERLAVVPSIGFDGDLRVNGQSVGEVGISVQYVLWP